MIRTIQATTLRSHMAETLKSLAKQGKFMLITKKDKPVSALVNLDFFEDLLALTGKEYLKSIQEAREDYKKGHLFSHQEVFGNLE